MEPTCHISVMPDEVLHWLQPAPGKKLVDGTLGGGGHTRLLAPAVGPDGWVLGIDRDPVAVAAAESSLRGLPVKVAHASYRELPALLTEIGEPLIDGIVLDLGLSSDQLADRERGFSFDSDGPLDLRFDPTSGIPAWRWLQRVNEGDLADVIYRYGEDRFSRRIARRIFAARADIRTATDLARIVRGAVPRNPADKIDPATRTFQALRIAVNGELDELTALLARLPDCLRPDGRLAVISFHSLEDRIVKQALRDDPRYEPLTPKPLTPGVAELERNPRSRSAKLRVARRV